MKDYPITIEFPVHWSDLDALGHVNHARFLTWMESARIALFEQVGLAWKNQPTHGPILANLNVDYRAPVHYPSMIVCGVRVQRIGNTSFVLEYGVAQSKSLDEFVAVGTSVIVLYDYQAATTVPIPQQLRSELSGI